MLPFLEWCLSVLTTLNLYVVPLFVVWLIMAIFRSTRAIASTAIFLTSVFWGLLLWCICAVILFAGSGWVVFVIGCLLFGIGVVPLTVVMALVHAQWSVVGMILMWLVFVFGARLFNGWLNLTLGHGTQVADQYV